MGTWGTSIKGSDAFADVYGEFMELYNSGENPEDISRRLRSEFWEILEIEEEKHSYWFAFALAQWETKSLEPEVLSMVEHIVSSDEDLKLWRRLGASAKDLERREFALDAFLQKIKSDRPKAKARRKRKVMTPIFAVGDCLIFRMKSGSYGGAVVLAAATSSAYPSNLVVTTRLNQIAKPVPLDFENAEVLVCNFGEWKDRPHVMWCAPDLYEKNYSDIYERIGPMTVEVDYVQGSSRGTDNHFTEMFTSGWQMRYAAEAQFESEVTKPKPPRSLTIRQLTRAGQK